MSGHTALAQKVSETRPCRSLKCSVHPPKRTPRARPGARDQSNSGS
jgi:hypothetical protein